MLLVVVFVIEECVVTRSAHFSGASDVVFDHAAHAVYFLASGRLEACPGRRRLPQSNPASAKLR